MSRLVDEVGGYLDVLSRLYPKHKIEHVDPSLSLLSFTRTRIAVIQNNRQLIGQRLAAALLAN